MMKNLVKPLVSIIVPAFNAEKFIVECLLSLQKQTYRNLEIIVVNDGSFDNTDSLIRSVIQGDSRFIYIARENLGLVATLNQMISMSTGQLIARMDADDVADDDRISQQVEFFSKNPKVAVVGCRTVIIDENGTSIGACRRPVSTSEVSAYFLYGSPLAHPTVMFNLEIISKKELVYDSSAYPVEDLDLWLRLARKYKIANLRLPLLKYRITTNGISQTNKQRQEQKSAELRKDFFSTNARLVAFVDSIENDSGSLLVNSLKRLKYALCAGSLRGPYNVLSILKIWARTVVRDIRSQGA